MLIEGGQQIAGLDAVVARQLTKQLRREGFDIGRDRVGRLMAELGIQGLARASPSAPPRPTPPPPGPLTW